MPKACSLNLPSYPKMIIEAVKNITGKVSRASITNYITKNYGVDVSDPAVKIDMEESMQLVLKLGLLRRRSHYHFTPSAGKFEQVDTIRRLTVFQSVPYWPETYASVRKTRSDLEVRKPTYLLKKAAKTVVEDTKSQSETAFIQNSLNATVYPAETDFGEPVCTSTPKKTISFKRRRQEQEGQINQPLAKRTLNIYGEARQGVVIKSTKTDMDLSIAVDLKMRVKSARTDEMFTKADEEGSDKENVM